MSKTNGTDFKAEIDMISCDIHYDNLLLKVLLSLFPVYLVLLLVFVLGWAYRGLTGGFLLLQNFSVAISVSPHVSFILVLILISMFLR